MVQNLETNEQEFQLMNDYLLEINITPRAAEPTWAKLADGISGYEPSGNEETDQTQYMSGKGYATTTVTGKQETYSISGHRLTGDPAQDYIYSYPVKHGLGKARETQGRITDPSGEVIVGPVTLTAIEGPSGEAGTKGEISFEVHFNGKPELQPPAAPDPAE